MKETATGFETYFRQYLKRGISGGGPWSRWDYKDDLIVKGCYDLFCVTGDSFYRDVILKITEGRLLPDDAPCPYNLDMISGARTDMVFERLTGEDRFHQRFLKKMELFKEYPRTRNGNFWHKDIYPNQVWLDGLYMAMPVYLQDPVNSEDAMSQYENVRRILFVPEKGLYVHAWDEERRREWADSETGLSPNVWLRAMGWYLMSLADCYELVEQKQEERLAELLQEALDHLMKFQDPGTRMFYQLVDLPGEKGNYPETSGSAMAAYACMKGERLGMLRSGSFEAGAQILKGIGDTWLRNRNGTWTLGGICESAGLGPGPYNRRDRDGSVKYYLSEPVVEDNQHGVGACMMAWSEWLLGDNPPH